MLTPEMLRMLILPFLATEQDREQFAQQIAEFLRNNDIDGITIYRRNHADIYAGTPEKIALLAVTTAVQVLDVEAGS